MEQKKLHLRDPLETTNLMQIADVMSLQECINSSRGVCIVAEGEMPPPPGPLLTYPSMRLKEWIDSVSHMIASIPPVGCAFLEGYVYGCGQILVDGALAVEDIGLSQVAKEWHQAAFPSLQERAVVVVDEPAISFVGPGHRVYGHWLMDFIPRLQVARELLGPDLSRFSLLLPTDTPDYVVRLCTNLIGKNLRFGTFDPDGQILKCTKLCVPSSPFSLLHHFHSIVEKAYRPFRPTQPGSRRLCISRKKMEHQSTGIAKTFPERDIFEATACYYGYEIVYPEQMSLLDQIALFNNARIVIGEFGSGLHNSIFCAPGTIVAACGFFSDGQLRVCQLFDQTSAYLVQQWDAVRDDGLHYSCDPISMAEFFKCLEDALKPASGSDASPAS